MRRKSLNFLTLRICAHFGKYLITTTTILGRAGTEIVHSFLQSVLAEPETRKIAVKGVLL